MRYDEQVSELLPFVLSPCDEVHCPRPVGSFLLLCEDRAGRYHERVSEGFPISAIEAPPAFLSGDSAGRPRHEGAHRAIQRQLVRVWASRPPLRPSLVPVHRLTPAPSLAPPGQTTLSDTGRNPLEARGRPPRPSCPATAPAPSPSRSRRGKSRASGPRRCWGRQRRPETGGPRALASASAPHPSTRAARASSCRRPGRPGRERTARPGQTCGRRWGSLAPPGGREEQRNRTAGAPPAACPWDRHTRSPTAPPRGRR